MKKIVALLFLSYHLPVFGQEPLLKVGNSFPDIIFTNISNAPVKEFYLNKEKDNKFYILNFWGTWCSPCIPEMDTLAKLQKANASKLKVIAISDDNEERKAKYLKNKPSDIWLATDTAYTLYNMLNLAFVGQSAIINPDKKIVALVRTDSINQQMINTLLKGDTVRMSAGIKEPQVGNNDDPFGVDTLTSHNFTISGYKTGRSSMGKSYSRGIYAGRRINWVNVSTSTLYRAAYGIKTYKIQERFESGLTEKDVSDFENKSTLLSMDLLVQSEQKDSLYIILQQKLNHYLPIKVRQELEVMDVYILQKKENTPVTIKLSQEENISLAFSGKGFDGKKVTLNDFADIYLTNELSLPVVDETGLTGFYDIKTNVEQRNREGILKSIDNLGLEVVKRKKEMPVIVYHR